MGFSQDIKKPLLYWGIRNFFVSFDTKKKNQLNVESAGEGVKT